MTSTQPASGDDPASPTESIEDRERVIRANEPRNLAALAVHFVVLRVAWIFKTESVIMPAVVDSIAGAGWVRGCLPVLNRVGQSIPSMLLADRVRDLKYKKYGVFAFTLSMAIPFLSLSVAWMVIDDKRQPWIMALFLVLYFAFFTLAGLSQLAFATLQGKLLRADRRGRLVSISGIVGSVAAIACAWYFLRHWLTLADGGYAYIFGFTGLGFCVAAMLSFLVSEPPDTPGEKRHSAQHHFREAWMVFCHDADFRRLAVVAMFFVLGQLLFPHYQALGRTQPDFAHTRLMVWVIVQNAGTGLFSWVSGSLADRFGNRLVLRIQVLAAALIPLLAIWLARLGTDHGRHLFWITFFALGTTPVVFRTLVNYTLEISTSDQHPRYLSTLKVTMAVPFLISPVVGLLVDRLGFTAVFFSMSGLMAIGGLLTFRLVEPRHRPEF